MQFVKGSYESEETKRMINQVSNPKGMSSALPQIHPDQLDQQQYKHTNVPTPSDSTSRSHKSLNSIIHTTPTNEAKKILNMEKSPSGEPSANDTVDSTSRSEYLKSKQGELSDQENNTASLKICEISLDQEKFKVPIFEAMFLMSSMSRFGKSISSIRDTFGK